jgi:ketosteroid isomerase-like protein
MHNTGGEGGSLMRWVFLLICLLAQPAGADVKQELQAVYAKIAKAMKAKDLAGVSRYVAPDYQQKGLTGPARGRADTEADHQQTFASCQTISMNVGIRSVSTKGNLAVASVNYVVSMVSKPELDPAGKTHKVTAAVPLRHTWKKTAKGWLLYRSLELKGGTLTMDGKRQKINRG